MGHGATTYSHIAKVKISRVGSIYIQGEPIKRDDSIKLGVGFCFTIRLEFDIRKCNII